MNILIAGASGMVGQALVQALQAKHELVVLGRDINRLKQQFPKLHCLTWDGLDQYQADVDIVIHLSGANIGQGFWTDGFKQKVLNSRVDTAKKLGAWATQLPKPPRILAANAVGYYGAHSFEEGMDETTEININAAKGFLQEVAFAWQEAWTGFPLDVCIMRFGVVLAKHQGMLKKLYPSFYLGAGSILGDGQQTISWIHLDDLVAAILWIMEHPEYAGPFNLVSPHPVRQAEFARCLAKTLHRPLLLKMPQTMVRFLFGQMGQELLLEGQAVYPKRLLEHGFQFKFSELAAALAHEYA
jgi:uncharacterized protein (TIGR01777 family)